MDKEEEYNGMIKSFYIAHDNLSEIYGKMREMKISGELSVEQKDWLELHVKALHKDIIKINDLLISKIK